MQHTDSGAYSRDDSHVFLGTGHAQNERAAWAAIALTLFMMVAEIVGGTFFGSLAVIADGFHMASHALALLIAALAYTFARRHAHDARFVFGTGKFGDLAGFTSAIVLAMIALIIGYEAVARLFVPVAIRFDEALLIAAGGFVVNVVTAWLLSGGEINRPAHAHTAAEHGQGNVYRLDLVEETHSASSISAAERDNNMRAAFVHVAGDAAVSVLAICGLLLGRFFGWVFMDPVMGIMGALVIANWSYGLARNTASVLLDMNPDKEVTEKLRHMIESGGDRLTDFHLWRLGPGHLGAILSVLTEQPRRDAEFYRSRLGKFPMLSHVTIEVKRKQRESQSPSFGQDLVQKLRSLF